jgi:hypothetical protein
MTSDLLLPDGTVIPEEKRTRCLVYSRIVGYLTPVVNWNKGKQSEWADRVAYVASKIESGEVKDGGDA